jgi:hypothetical protein
MPMGSSPYRLLSALLSALLLISSAQTWVHSERQYLRDRNPSLNTTISFLTLIGPSPGAPAPRQPINLMAYNDLAGRHPQLGGWAGTTLLLCSHQIQSSAEASQIEAAPGASH